MKVPVGRQRKGACPDTKRSADTGSRLRFLRVATEAALPSVQGDPKSFEAFRQERARMEPSPMLIWTARWACSATRNIASRGFGSCRPSMASTSSSATNQGGLMDPTLVRQSMTLFAQEVMPHFR
jgi:hypothetical protein